MSYLTKVERGYSSQRVILHVFEITALRDLFGIKLKPLTNC